jgi:hypothetical protein
VACSLASADTCYQYERRLKTYFRVM